jgi:septum site-determining protein MinD
MSDGDADTVEVTDANERALGEDAADERADEAPGAEPVAAVVEHAEHAERDDAGRVIAIASGKGGVGKTTTVVNVAAWMTAAGRDVVVVDFDLGMANVADFLDFEPPSRTLHDVLADEGDPAEAIAEVPGGFGVVPGGTTLADFGKADPAKLGGVVDHLREHYDVVLLDTGAGLSHDTSLPLGLADEVLLVTTAQAASLANTRKTRELAERLSGTISGVVVTRVGGGSGERPEAVGDAFDLPVLGSIPEDRSTAGAATAGVPLREHAPDSPAAQAYRELAYDLLGESLPLDFRDDATDTPEDTASDVEPSAPEEIEEAEPPAKPSLLSRLTGGLIGNKKS